MDVTRWWLVVLTLTSGCSKPSSSPGGVRDFSIGLIGEHGPEVSVRLDVPKGWKVRPDPYAAVLVAPGASELEPTVMVTASNCTKVRDPSTLELRVATATECLVARATVAPGSPPAPAVETTAAGPRIVKPGAGAGSALEIITLTPDQTVDLACSVRGTGAVLAQARAVCEGMVVENVRP